MKIKLFHLPCLFHHMQQPKYFYAVRGSDIIIVLCKPKIHRQKSGSYLDSSPQVVMIFVTQMLFFMRRRCIASPLREIHILPLFHNGLESLEFHIKCYKLFFPRSGGSWKGSGKTDWLFIYSLSFHQKLIEWLRDV